MQGAFSKYDKKEEKYLKVQTFLPFLSCVIELLNKKFHGLSPSGGFAFDQAVPKNHSAI